MDAKTINHALNVQFVRYDYRLNNVLLFSEGESDFVCRSDAGYWVECEVKISRADFYRDFKKPKHKVFESLQQGRQLIVEKYPYGKHDPGDVICVYDQPVIRWQHPKGQHWGHQSNSPWREYWVANDYGHARVELERIVLRAPCTPIHFRDLTKENQPHQFYFAVPRDLVKLAEIPDYAGLIYVDDDRTLEVIRRAPYLHKRKMDLSKVLLQKYYNLWRFKAECDKYEACYNLNLYAL